MAEAREISIGNTVCDKYTGSCGRVVSILNDEVTIEPTTIKRGPRGEYLEVTEPPLRAKIANLEPDHIRRYEELPSGHRSGKRNREVGNMAEDREISPLWIIPVGIILGLAAALGIAALAAAAPPAPPPGRANLYGEVTDAVTEEAIPGVLVTLNGLEVHTDSGGNYIFEDLEPGEYVLQFSKEGYETATY